MQWDSDTTDEDILKEFMSHFPYDYKNVEQRKFVFDSLMFKRHLLAVRWQILKDSIIEDIEKKRRMIYEVFRRIIG